MNYVNLYNIVEGLTADRQKIIDTINEMKDTATKTNVAFAGKWVSIDYNGVSLVYTLFFDGAKIEGKISIESIYHQTYFLKTYFDLEKKISEMIETDATNRFFNSEQQK